MKHTLTYHGETIRFDVDAVEGGYRVTLNGETHFFEQVRVSGAEIQLTWKGRNITLHAASAKGSRWVAHNGRIYRFDPVVPARRRASGASPSASDLHAPMPGQIRAIEVELGESVTAGQTLMVMEAMKMEIKIQASQDGVVERIEVEVGETVEKEQLLVVVDPKISPDED